MYPQCPRYSEDLQRSVYTNSILIHELAQLHYLITCIIFYCILIQCAPSMEGTGSFCLTSVISVGKTALARELRKSEEAHRASRGK